jgi:DNA-binding transcriptional LysR family regulator
MLVAGADDAMTCPRPCTSTTTSASCKAVLNHLGIGVLPDYITEDFPQSGSRACPKLESSEVPVFLAYPEELRHSKRVAAFRDFVTEEIFNYRRRQQP